MSKQRLRCRPAPPLSAAAAAAVTAWIARRPLLHASSPQGCTHALKLRDCLKLDAQIQLEFGLDFCLAPGASHDARSLLRSAAPWLAVQRQLDPADQGLGVLRADLHHLSFTRRFHLLAPKGARWSLPVDLKVGKSYDGALCSWVVCPSQGSPWQQQPSPRPLCSRPSCSAPPVRAARPPHVGVQFGDWRVTLSLAALLLATGKPVHLSHREVGCRCRRATAGWGHACLLASGRTAAALRPACKQHNKPLLPLGQVGPPALHFPLYFGGARHKEALTERVRGCLPSGEGRHARCAWPQSGRPAACGQPALPAACLSELTSRALQPPSLAHYPAPQLSAVAPFSRSAQVEVDATLQRRGRWLAVDVHQLNGVLRLREE